eukprot:365715-Chlamydomonas_euryale.AAC.7
MVPCPYRASPGWGCVTAHETRFPRELEMLSIPRRWISTSGSACPCMLEYPPQRQLARRRRRCRVHPLPARPHASGGEACSTVVPRGIRSHSDRLDEQHACACVCVYK